MNVTLANRLSRLSIVFTTFLPFTRDALSAVNDHLVVVTRWRVQGRVGVDPLAELALALAEFPQKTLYLVGERMAGPDAERIRTATGVGFNRRLGRRHQPRANRSDDRLEMIED